MTFLLASWEDVRDFALTDGIRIAIIILVAMAADLLIHRAVPRLFRLGMEGQLKERSAEEVAKRADTLSHVATGSARVLIILIALFTILPLAGIDIAPLLASVGVAGIAIGFGAQNLVKDIIRGIYIIVDDQYSKGDVVTVAGISGLVEDLSLRRTVLRDLDGIVHYVPNGEITVASNFTQEYSRVNLNVRVSYDEDIDRVIDVINKVGKELAQDPDWAAMIRSAPEVLRVDSLAESGVELKIVGDTAPIKQWDVMGELRKRIKRAFDEEGIEIPFPHRVIVPRDTKVTDLESKQGETK
ncbi:MAG TPA: mechanosensitive ion channel family protein [Dehalococcoidia bacterium]|nr:mechanosensitive ion channel family protein [Dehalococcoidia bacterium]